MGNGNASMWSLRVRNGTDQWRAQHWSTPDYDFDTPGFSGNWAHMVLVHDGTQGRAYYNGQLVGSEASTLSTGGDDLEIGRYNENNGDIWTGEIDDVAFWSTETLSDAEINALYHLGLPTSFDNLSSPFGFNLNAEEVDQLLAFHDDADPDASISFGDPDFEWTYVEDLNAIGMVDLGQPFQVGDTTYVQLSAVGTGTGLAFAEVVVPEPSTIAIWSILGLGLAGFGYYRVRHKK